MLGLCPNQAPQLFCQGWDVRQLLSEIISSSPPAAAKILFADAVAAVNIQPLQSRQSCQLLKPCICQPWRTMHISVCCVSCATAGIDSSVNLPPINSALQLVGSACRPSPSAAACAVLCLLAAGLRLGSCCRCVRSRPDPCSTPAARCPNTARWPDPAAAASCLGQTCAAQRP